MNIEVEFKNFSCSGDIFYKGFNVSEVLFPAKVEFSGNLVDNNNQIKETFSITPTKLNPTYNKFQFTATDTINYNQYKFVFKTKNFIYDESNKADFTHRKNDIEYYYNADARMSMAFADLKKSICKILI